MTEQTDHPERHAFDIAEDINGMLDGVMAAEAFVALSMVVAIGLQDLRKHTKDPDAAMTDVLIKFVDSVKTHVAALEEDGDEG